MNIFSRFFSDTTNTAPKKEDEKAVDIKKRAIQYEQQLTRARQDIATWRSAQNSAESILFPQRENLYRLYLDVVNDAHVTSLMQIRMNAVLSSKFLVKRKEIILEDKTEFIDSKWFRQTVQLAMESRFYGHSLIQYGDFEAGGFKSVTLVPRQYVKPEFDLVVPMPSMMEGVNFTKAPFDKWCIGVGEPRDLGILCKAAPLVLWKKLALASWSIFISTAAVPIRTLRTDAMDDDTRAEYENMMKNLADSAYGIIGKDDELQMHEVRGIDIFQTFDSMIKRVNDELSLLFVGQTSTSNDKNFVGSAEVHERIFKTYNLVDHHFINDFFKEQLVPLLNKHGLGFQNLRINAEPDDVFSLQEKAKFDIELLKTKQYTIPPEYITKTYGTPVSLKPMIGPNGKKIDENGTTPDIVTKNPTEELSPL